MKIDKKVIEKLKPCEDRFDPSLAVMDPTTRHIAKLKDLAVRYDKHCAIYPLQNTVQIGPHIFNYSAYSIDQGLFEALFYLQEKLVTKQISQSIEEKTYENK